MAKSNVADTTHPIDVEKVKQATEVKPGRKSITLQIYSHVALSYRLLCYLWQTGLLVVIALVDRTLIDLSVYIHTNMETVRCYLGCVLDITDSNLRKESWIKEWD